VTVGAGGDADVQAAFAATLVDEWARCGVVHAVVCPGSRSTPMAVALAAHPALTVHVRLDERSAAFTALGIGLATGRPAVILTTSGTAAAELHAAVVEADLSCVPIVACTADRPPELRDVGAPQTIDQTHLFGRSVRWFADPGVPDAAAKDSWRSLAARVVAEATVGGDGPGPVHLNLPFREPLLGDPSRAGGVVPGRTDGGPFHMAVGGPRRPPGPVVADLVDGGVVVPSRRGVIVAGAGCDGSGDILALAAALGWPVLAEPRSGLRGPDPGVVATADALLRSARFAGAHRPEVVLRLGERWVSKVVNGFLAGAVEAGARSILVESSGRWLDPERSVDLLVRSDPGQFCRDVTIALAHGLPERIGPPVAGWAEAWWGAERDARAAIVTALTGSGEMTPGLNEPALAHRLFAVLPAGATLVVSSSMPVRDIESFALASGGPTVALVGDLAFLHDVSALVRASGSSPDLTVVVADNGGGGIFSFLDPATVLDSGTFETLFGTPQATDPAAVAAGFGWSVITVEAGADPAVFDEAVQRGLAEGGCSVVCVRLPGRADNVAEHRRVNDAVVAAVGG
jgi:2-succinyl-5-enolpyruvyl-6-hydroxy-3-cyclohexene-1-carboxylate synthase